MPTILAVDDNQVHCYALGRLLAAKGYNVLTAQTGSDAMRTIAEAKPDVILMDVNLPDANGIELCETIRQTPGFENVAIIFHTATSANEASRARAESAGADAFLTYPINTEQLVSTIEGTVKRRNSK